MSNRKERVESCVSASDSSPFEEFLEYLDDKVPDDGDVFKGVEPSVPLPTPENEENEENEKKENEENKSKEESGEIKCKEGKRKRGRPSEKDKEGLPVSKKVKQSPRKKKNLKIMVNENKGKSNGYNKFFKRAVTEKCIFCQEEHLRETFWEGVGRDKSEIRQIPICMRCHACLKDAAIMNEIREAIEKGVSKLKGEDEKLGFSCGACQKTIKKSHGSVKCTRCSLWIHLSCTKFTSSNEAGKYKHVFKCKNCEEKCETPKTTNKNKDLNVKNVEEITDRVLLSGIGTHNFYRNISKTDLESLDDGKWVTDNIITLIFKNIQQNVDGCKIALVEPSITQILRKSADLDHVRGTVKDLKLDENNYVFLPVNDNNKLDGEGGSHWSLLVYAADEKHRGFYHHDPIGRANLQHATELMERLSKADGFFKNKMNEADSPKQINNYDCGIYASIYAGMLAKGIAEGADPKVPNITPEEVIKCRKTLRQKIRAEKELLDKDRKANKVKQSNTKNINNDNRKQTNNRKPRTDNICGRWINYICREGRDCPFEHPTICESDVNRTVCRKDPCDLYHPQICSTNLMRRVCKWGEVCKFRHIYTYNDVQGQSYENNKNRHDRHHDHYGNNHLTGDQNNYGHQNKRAPHNPNTHKNYNINSKQIYRKAYGDYKGHVNSHHSYEKHNTNNRQGPQINHLNERSNQNVNFLGYHQNPMDWPTPMEEKLLKTLRELIRVESESWGPARLWR